MGGTNPEIKQALAASQDLLKDGEINKDEAEKISTTLLDKKPGLESEDFQEFFKNAPETYTNTLDTLINSVKDKLATNSEIDAAKKQELENFLNRLVTEKNTFLTTKNQPTASNMIDNRASTPPVSPEGDATKDSNADTQGDQTQQPNNQNPVAANGAGNETKAESLSILTQDDYINAIGDTPETRGVLKNIINGLSNQFKNKFAKGRQEAIQQTTEELKKETKGKGGLFINEEKLATNMVDMTEKAFKNHVNVDSLSIASTHIIIQLIHSNMEKKGLLNKNNNKQFNIEKAEYMQNILKNISNTEFLAHNFPQVGVLQKNMTDFVNETKTDISNRFKSIDSKNFIQTINKKDSEENKNLQTDLDSIVKTKADKILGGDTLTTIKNFSKQVNLKEPQTLDEIKTTDKKLLDELSSDIPLSKEDFGSFAKQKTSEGLKKLAGGDIKLIKGDDGKTTFVLTDKEGKETQFKSTGEFLLFLLGRFFGFGLDSQTESSKDVAKDQTQKIGEGLGNLKSEEYKKVDQATYKSFETYFATNEEAKALLPEFGTLPIENMFTMMVDQKIPYGSMMAEFQQTPEATAATNIEKDANGQQKLSAAGEIAYKNFLLQKGLEKIAVHNKDTSKKEKFTTAGQIQEQLIYFAQTGKLLERDTPQTPTTETEKQSVGQNPTETPTTQPTNGKTPETGATTTEKTTDGDQTKKPESSTDNKQDKSATKPNTKKSTNKK